MPTLQYQQALQSAKKLRALTEQQAQRKRFLESLADRTRPLPAGVTVERLLKAAQDQLVREVCQEWGIM